VTSDNRKHGGIHPVVALESHEANLGGLVNDALQHLPPSSNDHRNTGRALAISRGSEVQWKVKPDFVSVTRGPGMRSNLAAGLGTAKGLSIAWQVPLVGVHHMQAHALTPRLVTALQSPPEALRTPDFSFLSLLVSGGHTMLLNSRSLTEHTTIASTVDVAIGDSLDKAARMILPPDWIAGSTNTGYGRLLEQFAFPRGEKDYNYSPLSRAEELVPSSLLGHKLMLPLATTRALKFSFAGIPSTVERVLDASLPQEITHEERVKLARTVLQVSFEHLASRIVIALEDQESLRSAKTLVISGGVASNHYLKAVIRSVLDLRGFSHLNIVYPPPSLCTDNAAMIAWAGVEMFGAGWTTDLSCAAIRKWSMDPASGDGGILGATGWVRK
jgi:N6-L-threonylcarbamoyladenine synthase